MIKASLLGLFFTSLTIQALPASDLLSTQIKTFNQVVKNTGIPKSGSFCVETMGDTSKTARVYSAQNKKSIELTVLSLDEAMNLFQELKNDEENSFDSPLDACFARAHRMAQVMDERDIISGKAFVEGELFVDTKFGELGWSYHAASIIMVKDKGVLTPTIMDPTLFDKPVSYDEWKKLLIKKPYSKLKSEYFTKRFNYDIREKNADPIQYDEDQLEDMKIKIKENARTGHMIELMEKNK